jgi:Ca2+/H+ antiporter
VKRTKYIPAIITLIGCLAATIITFLNRYTALKSMIIILIVLIVFYIAGLIIKGLADKYLLIEEEKLNEEAAAEEEETAENVEKTSEDPNEAENK